MPGEIEDYQCDKCNKKVTITMKKYLAELPNVLIIHLQRISYNYETDRQEKINSRLEFPKELNLKQYTIEEKMANDFREKQKGKFEEIKDDAGDTDDVEGEKETFETDDIYYKTDGYYDYYLVGVIIHTGSAESGHYYSYINTIRNGDTSNSNQSYFDKKNESHSSSWLEFNDSCISRFDIKKLEDECFGGNYGDGNTDNVHTPKKGSGGRVGFYGGSGFRYEPTGEKSKSAYLLVYERKIKSPLKIVVNKPEEITNLISYKEDEASKIKKEYDICRKSTSLTEINNLCEKLKKTTFYDVNRDEYYQNKPFYSVQRIIPKKYYLDIEEENSLFLNKQNISDSQFVTFFDNVINELDKTLTNMKGTNPETLGKIAAQLLNFIFNILSQKDKQQVIHN